MRFSKDRRKFLKRSAAGLAGLVAGCGSDPGNSQSKPSGGWNDIFQINPQINNLKVVSCKDGNMVSSMPLLYDFRTMNDAINTSVVNNNMDQMAKELAGKTDPNQAWATIFQKPETKQWNQATVAFKVNCIEANLMPKAVIIDKVCEELNRLGVPYENMIIYDGCSNATGNNKYTYSGIGLHEGVNVSNGNGLLNSTVSSYVPEPYDGWANCSADISNGTIDILINCAVNKGHGSEYGGATLSMKNHFGTFQPIHSYNYLIGINKSDAIIGGNPPRQQLVIIDSIAAMTYGPGGVPNVWPNRIIMGTFGPAVDYVTAKMVRGLEMNSLPSSQLENFLLDFGYTEEERDAMVLTEVAPV